MTDRPWTAGAQALLLAAALLLLLVGAGTAWAGEGDEPEAPPAAENAEKSDELKADDLEEQLLAHPGARWALLIGRFVPIVIGVILLILWFLKQDKIKGGVLPRPAPAEPTLAIGLGMGVVWGVVGLVVGPAVVIVIIGGGVLDPAKMPLWQTVLAMSVCSIPVALWLLYNRRRAQRATLGELQMRHGPGVAPPTRPPGMARAFGVGVWTFCVAGVCVVPVALAWALVLTSAGSEPVAQEPVRDMLDKSSHAGPIIMAVFGILVAPFTEECIFRGMLYPGVKRALGGGRRAAWIGIVLVSAIFAAVHGNLYAALPLFALALVLNLIFEATNSLAAVIFAHALHNGVTMIPLLIVRYSS